MAPLIITPPPLYRQHDTITSVSTSPPDRPSHNTDLTLTSPRLSNDCHTSRCPPVPLSLVSSSASQQWCCWYSCVSNISCLLLISLIVRCRSSGLCLRPDMEQDLFLGRIQEQSGYPFWCIRIHGHRDLLRILLRCRHTWLHVRESVSTRTSIKLTLVQRLAA